MERSRAQGRRPASAGLLTSPGALRAVPFVALAVLLGSDVAGGRDVRIGGLMVAVPALSAVFLGPYTVMAVAVVTIGCVVTAAANNHTIDSNFPIVMTTTVLIGVASTMAAGLRQRREQQLAQVRRVAAVTQRALLRPLPSRLGRVTISSMYLAADREADIGGDLYAAAVTRHGATRVLIGDVQGKGLSAVEVTGLILNAFRRSVRARTPLVALPGYLDEILRDDLADLADEEDPAASDGSPLMPAEPRFLERFATAVVIDIPGDGGAVQMANCGHPPPLLIRRGAVEHILPSEPDLPLGLGDLMPRSGTIDTCDFAVGDVLLLYTDGVIEARDSEGTFYPLAERLAEGTATTPEALLAAVKSDLLRYTDARLTDDVAMVAVQRVS